MSTSSEILVTSDASGQLWNVCVWDVQSWTSLLTYKGGTSSPHCLAILNNDFLISAMPTKPILNIWTVHCRDNNQMRMVCPGKVTALDVTPDGAYCIAAVSEKIHIWQVCTGYLLAVLSRHYQNVTCLKCSSHGNLFVSGGDDNLVIVWSLPLILADAGNHRSRPEPMHVWAQHSLPITDVHVGFGGKQARVISSSLDQTCRLWDIVSGELLCCFVFDVGILSATMNLTETQLFAGGANGTIYTVCLYETPVKSERHIQKDSEADGITLFEGHTKQVTCLCVSMDGTQLVSGSHDWSVKVWDIYSGQCTKTLGHKGAITNANLVPRPPGIQKDYKRPQVCLQTFQRHLHIEGEASTEQGDNSNVLNLYMNHFDKALESDRTALKYGDYKQLQEMCNTKSEKREIMDLKEDVKRLKTVNQNLYEYATNELLNKPSS